MTFLTKLTWAAQPVQRFAYWWNSPNIESRCVLAFHTLPPPPLVLPNRRYKGYRIIIEVKVAGA
jgi:hypothetical protein